MIAGGLGQRWVQDLPVCLPGRACVDQSPVAAPLITATTALTPVSPLIAAAVLAVTGGALVVVVVVVRQRWHGRGGSAWTALLTAALLLFGTCSSWAVRARLATLSAVYGGLDDRAPAPVPASLVGAWPAVLTAAGLMAAAGALGLVALLGTAALRRRPGGVPR